MNPFFAPPWLDNQQAPVLFGPNFAVALPNGFLAQQTPTGFAVLPPGSTPPPLTPAIVMLDAIPPMYAPSMRQAMYSMDNPVGAWMQGLSLGLTNVQPMGPARPIPFAGATADIREIHGVSMMSGQPLRMVLMLLHGAAGTVKIVTAMNLFRWQEFFGPCLAFAGSVNVNGFQPAPPPPVHYQMEASGQQVSVRVGGQPFNTMPVVVKGNVVYNVYQNDNSINTGDISNSDGIAIGKEAAARVRKTGGKR